MIGEKKTFEWLEHRAGVRELSRHPSAYHTRALELNDKGNTFAAAYGRKEIKSFVGFVDLIGIWNERILKTISCWRDRESCPLRRTR
jgi:hypothetical protein